MSVSPHAHLDGLHMVGARQEFLRELRRVNIDCGNSNVTPIYTLGHLAFLSGVPYGHLRDMIRHTPSQYTEQKLAKKHGSGYRTIRVPGVALMKTQRFLLKSCLPAEPSSSISYAFTAGRGILGAAQMHVGARTVIKLDFSDFFGSISSKLVYRVFVRAGYPELLAFEMALLCTYGEPIEISSENDLKLPYRRIGRRCLPQGAPTSGAVSNFVLQDLDRSLRELEMSGFAVTRYADDITVSSANVLSRSDCQSVIATIASLGRPYGLSLNKNKTRILHNKNSYRILGLAVSSSGVGLSRPYKRKFESELFAIYKGGILKQSAFRGYRSEIDYIAYLWGHVAFAKGIDLAWGQAMSERLNSMNVPFVDTIKVFSRAGL